MYEKFWGLNTLPFENTPDPRNFLESEKHVEALSRLLYAAQEKKACAILTGGYGCGKTLVLRRMRFALEPKGYKFSVVTNPRLDDLDMLRMILRGFTGGEVPQRKADVLMALERFLTETANDGKHSVVVIDEGHSITDPAVFEELRLLLNFQTDTRYLLTLVLAGQSALNAMVDNDPQFNQRVSVKCDIPPLCSAETAEYIAYRLKRAGSRQQIFSPEDAELVAKYSAGIPRWINNICHMTLMNGYLGDSRKIAPELIVETSESLGRRETVPE